MCVLLLQCGRGGAKRPTGEVVFVIEANPANLGPRYATDRESLVKYLLRGEARLASEILPPKWASG